MSKIKHSLTCAYRDGEPGTSGLRRCVLTTGHEEPHDMALMVPLGYASVDLDKNHALHDVHVRNWRGTVYCKKCDKRVPLAIRNLDDITKQTFLCWEGYYSQKIAQLRLHFNDAKRRRDKLTKDIRRLKVTLSGKRLMAAQKRRRAIEMDARPLLHALSRFLSIKLQPRKQKAQER